MYLDVAFECVHSFKHNPSFRYEEAEEEKVLVPTVTRKQSLIAIFSITFQDRTFVAVTRSNHCHNHNHDKSSSSSVC